MKIVTSDEMHKTKSFISDIHFDEKYSIFNWLLHICFPIWRIQWISWHTLPRMTEVVLVMSSSAGMAWHRTSSQQLDRRSKFVSRIISPNGTFPFRSPSRKGNSDNLRSRSNTIRSSETRANIQYLPYWSSCSYENDLNDPYLIVR